MFYLFLYILFDIINTGEIMKKIVATCILCVIFDQLIKLIIAKEMVLNTSINIINSFFKITYVRNYGAAFSILSGNRIFLILVTLLALVFIYFIFIKNQNNKTLDNILYGILFGGIIGNLIDRIINSYVIDYLDFNIFGYNFPIFNFADICIVISVILIVIMTFRGNLYEKNNGK